MPSRRVVRTIAQVLLTVVVALVIASPALAATGDSGIGKNVGDELSSWAKFILPAAVALVGIPALVKRDLGQAVVVFLIAIVLGGFVWDPPAVKSISSKVLNSISGDAGNTDSTK
jgi:hypothetical protein